MYLLFLNPGTIKCTLILTQLVTGNEAIVLWTMESRIFCLLLVVQY